MSGHVNIDNIEIVLKQLRQMTIKITTDYYSTFDDTGPAQLDAFASPQCAVSFKKLLNMLKCMIYTISLQISQELELPKKLDIREAIFKLFNPFSRLFKEVLWCLINMACFLSVEQYQIFYGLELPVEIPTLFKQITDICESMSCPHKDILQLLWGFMTDF